MMKYLSKITLIIFLLASGVASAMSIREEKSYGNDGIDICYDTSQEIKKIIKDPNSCEQDYDCVGMKIACSMGCPIVNKDTEAKVKELLAQRNKCMCTMEYCEPAKEFGCVEGFCRAKEV